MEFRNVFRLCLIAVPILYLLGVCSLATFYMSANANMELSSAVIYGTRWPLVIFQSLGLL